MTFLDVLAMLTILSGAGALLQGLQAARYMKSWKRRKSVASLQRIEKKTVSPAGSAAVFRSAAEPSRPLEQGSIFQPAAAVFCPCKGIDPGFEKNVRSILDQDYGSFQVHFVVESRDDAAYSALQGLGVTSLLVAGHAIDRGQKVHNLAYGVQYVGRGADVLVFCDSDGRYPEDWLSNLIAPLEDPRVGVTTGYRWYVAQTRRLSTLLRSAWNAVALSALGDPGRSFAWGGSLAIRRSTFERIGVLQAWQGSVSDDYAITSATKAAGLKILFVPQCLIPSYGDCGWAELLEFTTRQMIITRVYHPALWRTAFMSYVLFNVTFVWLAVAALANPVAAGLWFVIYGLTTARSWLRFDAVKRFLPRAALSGAGWFYILCSPLVSLLYLYNVVRSALTVSIVWREIGYKLLSRHETLVTRTSGGD